MAVESEIVAKSEPILLLGAGKVKKSVFAAAQAYAPHVVAADGGARWAVRNDVALVAAIGDFDSIGAVARAAIARDRLFHVSEQETTDFEKCLSRIRAPLVIGVGFGGGRVDHHLAAFHVMLRHADRPCILLTKSDVVFIAPPKLSIALTKESRVSLFPLVPVVATSGGLRWPLNGERLAPGHRIGTSNRATGPVTLDVDRPGLLVILPGKELPHVVAALGGRQGGRWPVRTS